MRAPDGARLYKLLQYSKVLGLTSHHYRSSRLRDLRWHNFRAPSAVLLSKDPSTLTPLSQEEVEIKRARSWAVGEGNEGGEEQRGWAKGARIKRCEYQRSTVA